MYLSRRAMLAGLAASAPALYLRRAGAQAAHDTDRPQIPPGPFAGTRESLAQYEVPEWFRDAKFGIWAHWGPQSAIGDGDWYARNMYLQGSDQYNYHVQKYGHPSKFGYKDTIPAWKAERFDPAELIRAYKKAGAGYFMSMGVHHDNFDMWNSKHNPWNAAAMGPHKDIVGMWRQAARAEGLRFGVSEHLWISYKWFSVSHGSDLTGPLAGVPYDGANPANQSLYIASTQIWRDFGDGEWNESGIPLWWKKHWYARMQDLVDQHQPDLLYTDGALPFEDYGLATVAHLYNTSAARNGGRVEAVYFSKRDADCQHGTCVLDRERGVLSEISPRPWQTDTCIGEWHYKYGARYKTPKRVVDMLVDIVSRNGNLLLNFPLPASGELDLQERQILEEITDWMAVNREAIVGTRPWKIAGEGNEPAPEKAASEKFNERDRHDLTAADIRFTTKKDALYVFAMGWPQYSLTIASLAQGTELGVGKITDVRLLGRDAPLQFRQDQKGLTILLPQQAPSKHAVAFRVMGAI